MNRSYKRIAAFGALSMALGCGSESARSNAAGGAASANPSAGSDGHESGATAGNSGHAGGATAGGATAGGATAGGATASGATAGGGGHGGTTAQSPAGGAAGRSSGQAGAAQGGSSQLPVSTSTAAEVARKLGRSPNFLIGLGNDLNNDHSKDGAYTLGTTLDLHDAYLVASMQDGVWSSWKDWDPDGAFVDKLTDSASKAGVVPMFTMYGMRAIGDGNLSGLANDVFQKAYWNDIKILYQHLGKFNKPSLVHFEPDFWAYAEQQSHEDPSSLKVNLTGNVPECADLSNDLVGLGHCLVKLARMLAPKALVGFHASQWAASDPKATAAFLKKVGADSADVVIADLLDRDAGCFEAAVDPLCMRSGNFYWDETNTSSPNFHEYLAWSKAISSGVGRPMIWWQVPLGVPSSTAGRHGRSLPRQPRSLHLLARSRVRGRRRPGRVLWRRVPSIRRTSTLTAASSRRRSLAISKARTLCPRRDRACRSACAISFGSMPAREAIAKRAPC